MENIVQDVTGVVEYAVMEYEEEDIDQQIEQLKQEKFVRDEKLKQRSNSIEIPKDKLPDLLRPE